jgi:hypothetical protein
MLSINGLFETESMTNCVIGGAGLALAILSPLSPVVFPTIGRKWAGAGFIAGLVLIGAVLIFPSG